MARTRKTPHLDPDALERILEVTRRLAAPIELRTLLGEIVDAARIVLRADRGSVFLYDAQQHELVTAVATGVGTLRFPADRGIVGDCAQSRRVVNVPDCYADPRFNPEADRQTGYRTRCLLAVPLVADDGALVGVLQILNKEHGVFDAGDERTATTLAAQCAVAIRRAQMTEQLVAKEKLDRELALAREIQIALLPKSAPVLPGYELAGLSRPAEETGGDTYDFVPLSEDRLIVLLGDATGHGIGPALSVTQVRSMLRIALRLGAPLDEAYRHINDQLVDDLSSNRAVTAFLGLLDTRTHELSFHAAGQAPLLHWHAATGGFEWIGATGMPMGFFPQRKPPRANTLRFEAGDVLGLLTDGVYECEDPADQPLGTEGIEALWRASLDEPMAGLAERIAERVREHAGGRPQADDVTIVLVRRLP
jgi:phosphoserine phosphatase